MNEMAGGIPCHFFLKLAKFQTMYHYDYFPSPSKEESKHNDIADDISQTNKNDNKQTVILEIESK